MTPHALFLRLANAYPATSTWMIGPSEVKEWWEICGDAILAACAVTGCDPSGTACEQTEYWRRAYRVLEAASEVMISVEVEMMSL